MSDKLQEKILIVDDEDDWLQLLEESIGKTGLSFVSARSAAEALERLADTPIFLVIADLVMPEKDGIELCQDIRQKTSDLPFVIISAKADRDRVIQSLRSGVTDILDKPFNNESLQILCRNFATKRLERIRIEESEAETLLSIFLDEARDQLMGIDETLLNLEKNPDNKADLDRLFRKIHTIKGSSGAIRKAESLTRLAHAMESLLSRLKENALKPSSAIVDLLLAASDMLSVQLRAVEGHCEFPDTADIIQNLQIAVAEGQVAAGARNVVSEKSESRGDSESDNGVYVPTEKLDSFLEMVGELVAVKNAFYMFYREQNQLSESAQSAAKDIAQTLDKVSDRIQSQLMEVRKVSLKKVFSKLPRITRQVCAELRKDAVLELSGEDVAVDKSIANVLSGCLSHAVRNSLDHGLENADERRAAGKSSGGRILVAAEDASDTIRIVVQDDGRGINREKVLAKAVSLGLIKEEEGAKLSDPDVFAFVFRAGFSTASQVTNISGRGVGMDAIYTAITSLGGKITMESNPGSGTRLTMTLPVLKTINVERSILLESEGLLYALPLKNVSTIKTLAAREITPLRNMLSFQFRGQATRVASYPEISRGHRASKEKFGERLAVVVSSKELNFGLLVDRVICQFDAIVRPFSKLVTDMKGFEGTAVVGNGKIAYVVNADEMISLAVGGPEKAA